MPCAAEQLEGAGQAVPCATGWQKKQNPENSKMVAMEIKYGRRRNMAACEKRGTVDDGRRKTAGYEEMLLEEML